MGREEEEKEKRQWQVVVVVTLMFCAFWSQDSIYQTFVPNF
jgi:hypothetical protein